MDLTITKLWSRYHSRIAALAVITVLLIFSKYFMNAGGVVPHYHLQLYDLGQHYIEDLTLLFGTKGAAWVWWAGSMSIEVCFAAVILTILVMGKGLKLGVALAVGVLLHSMFWHLTVLPIPNGIVWKFPFPTGQVPKPDDFWFSGHVAYAVLLALFAGGQRLWLQIISWLYVIAIICLVLAARTHYSIDIVGSFFVAYAIHSLITLKRKKRCYES